MADSGKYTKIVIAAIICAAVFASVILIVLASDSDSPVISFNTDLTISYSDADNQEKLLQGVTAWDKQDGDVSSSVVVESITPVSDGTQARVVYVARDNNNNITKSSRIINYTAGSVNQPVVSQPTKPDTQSMAETLPSGQQGNTGTTRNTGASGNATTPANASAVSASAVGSTAQANTGKSPVLTLMTKEVTINSGENFNVARYVQNITDDKDTRNELFRRILIQGSYDTLTPGDYEISVYCRDSDGNVSAMETLVLHVK